MNWEHTADLSDAFFRLILAMGGRMARDHAAALEATKNLLAVMMSESGVMSHPPHESVAHGLNQIIRLDLAGWHGTVAQYQALSAEAQLPYVENYFSGKEPLRTIAEIYTANFMPALESHARDPSFVICGERGPYAWAWEANWGAFDPKRVGEITVKSLLDRCARVTTGPRWDEIMVRLEDAYKALPAADATLVPQVLDFQHALKELGYQPGPLDAVMGPQTASAVRQYEGDMHRPVTGALSAGLGALLAVSLHDRAQKFFALAEALDNDAPAAT